MHARVLLFQIRLHTSATFPENCVNSLINTQQKGRPKRPFFPVPDRQHSLQMLAFRELEGLARLGTTVLLALNSARVAGEKTALLQNGAQIRFETGQRHGYPMTHRASLARQSTASHRADHAILASSSRSDQRLLSDHPQHRTG